MSRLRSVVLVLGFLSAMSTAWAQELASLVARVKPSVVKIEAEGKEGTSLGTGFVVRKEGIVITAQHVIQDARQMRVKFSNGKVVGVERVLYEDSERDFAILKIQGSDYPTVPLGDAGKLRAGDRVFVIGHPHGLSYTLTNGIVSGLRDSEMEEAQQGDRLTYVQVDAAVSPGNSGGPLFDMEGRAVGVIIFKRQGENLNFALAINQVLASIDRAPQPNPKSPSRPPTRPTTPPPTDPGPSTGTESWLIIASKSTSSDQSYAFVNGRDPLANQDWLHSMWKKGYSITDIAEGSNRWVIMMTKGPTVEFTNDEVFTEAEFPEEKVKASWAKDCYITSALYSGDRWLVVMSRYPAARARTMDQAYSLSADFPNDWIKKKSLEGFGITSVNGDGKRWLVVMSKGLRLGHQRIHIFSEVPRDWIKKGWDDGYYVTSIGSRSGQFVMVMTKGAGLENQAYSVGSTFPAAWIKDYWDRGWNVTVIR